MTAAIELLGLAKRFGRKQALLGIDLALDGAQLVGVVGPDGAGKTTLLRAIAGLLEIEARTARVLGHDLRGDVRALKACIGYVPQVFALQRELSVMENLRFTARLHRLAADVFERRAAQLLERTELAPFADRRAAALSGGMKQKLAIANALLPEPALLVLDECTAGVDVLARAEIFELLDERRADVLTLLSTSYLDEAERCDRLALLHQGRAMHVDTPARLKRLLPGAIVGVRSARPRAVLEAVRGLDGVLGALLVGDGVSLHVDDAQRRMPQLSAALAARGVPVDEMAPAEPSIEDLFVALLERHD